MPRLINELIRKLNNEANLKVNANSTRNEIHTREPCLILGPKKLQYNISTHGNFKRRLGVCIVGNLGMYVSGTITLANYFCPSYKVNY